MSDELDSADAPAAQLDPAEARRAKLITILLLNSRSRPDFSALVEHMDVVPEKEITRLYHECVEGLADWRGLRRLGTAECDPDLDAGFVSAVAGFYSGLMEYLVKGVRSEKKMAGARKRAAKYARQRCFTDSEASAERIVNSAVDLLESCSPRLPLDWMAKDPEKIPEKPTAQIPVLWPVEESDAEDDAGEQELPADIQKEEGGGQ